MEKEKEKHHTPISYGLYIAVWLSLLIFTALTVTVGGLDLRGLAVIVALFIATAKTTLVVTYFMHLKYEDRTFKIMLIFAIIILAVILLLTFSDTLTRHIIY